MINDKIAIFIDTNIFEKKGFNFDQRNEVLSQYKLLLEKEQYENIIVSVIDSEIKEHIKNKIQDNVKSIKKHCKWIYDVVDKNVIEENINKDLIDYERFKEITKTKYLDLCNINPELVMSKYFEIKYPFELSKRYEFKDAFFLESIYNYAKAHEEYSSFLVITNDTGIKKAIDEQANKKIVYFDSIEELLDSTIKYPHEDKLKIFDYVTKFDFESQLREKVKINIMDIEEEEIDIDSYVYEGVYFPKIIKKDKNKITIICDMNIVLKGFFRCLDYDNSYYSNEEGEYLFKSYKEKDYLSYFCQTLIEVNIENNELISANIIDLPEIDIDYESFCDLCDL